MPKKSKKSKKEVKVVEEETEYDRMDLEMLREVVPMLEQQLAKSRLDRNYVQLERDSIQQYFDVTKREVTEMELSLTAKEREMELLENNHRVTLRVYDQKIKHLEYAHKTTIELISSNAENTTLTSSSKLDTEKQKLLEKIKNDIINEKNRLEIENQEKISQLKKSHEEYLKKLSNQFDEGIKELIIRCESRKETIETEYELRRRVDIHEVEERKNLHINELINNHKKAFNQMKDYYNKITYENLNLIKSLQGQIRELKTRAESNKLTLLQYKHENDQLTELSAKEASRMAALQGQLRQRKNDKLALKNALSRQADVEKKLKVALDEFNKLRQEHALVEQEHKELCDTFEENIGLASDQSNEMNKALEIKLKSLKEKSAAMALDQLNSQLSLENKLNQVKQDLQLLHMSSSGAEGNGKGNGNGFNEDDEIDENRREFLLNNSNNNSSHYAGGDDDAKTMMTKDGIDAAASIESGEGRKYPLYTSKSMIISNSSKTGGLPVLDDESNSVVLETDVASAAAAGEEMTFSSKVEENNIDGEEIAANGEELKQSDEELIIPTETVPVTATVTTTGSEPETE